MRPQIVKILTLVLFIFASTTMLALQSSETSPPPPSHQRAPELPIDDSIIVLIALGIIYGCYIVLKRRSAIQTKP